MRKILTSLILLKLMKTQSDRPNACNNCIQCDLVNNKCIACNTFDFFYLSNGVCVKQQRRNCAAIDQFGRCVECESGFFRRRADCTPIVAISDCSTYDPKAPTTVCTQCVASHVLLLNKCFPKVENCMLYEESTGACFQCDHQMMFANNKTTCVPGNVTNCRAYEGWECRQCMSGFNLGFSLTDCYPQIENCLVDDGLSGCLVCNQGYFLSNQNNVCVKDIKGCDVYNFLGGVRSSVPCGVCGRDYILTQSGDCVMRYQHCLSADFQLQSCIYCREDALFSSDGQVCLRKVTHCESHLPSVYTDSQLKCESCLSGYRLTNDSLACLKPIRNCQVYSSESSVVSGFTCLICNGNTPPIANGTACPIVIPNCVTYNQPQMGCQDCATGYLLSNDTLSCLVTTPNCTDYEPSNTTLVCKKCADETVLVNNKTCVAETPHCSKTDLTTGQCQECATGFVLVTPSKLCVRAIDNCYMTEASNTSNNGLICRFCKPGFFLFENKCVFVVPNCGKFEGGKCTQCDSGYLISKSNNKCLKTIPFCSSYQQDSDDSNDLVCSVCFNGLLPTSDGFTCLPAIRFCESYHESAKSSLSLNCSKCIDNFSLSEGKCVSQSARNCLVFNDQTQLCTTCLSDFYLTTDGLRCLENVRFCVQYEDSKATSEHLLCSICSGGFRVTQDKRACFLMIRNCAEYQTSTYLDSSSKCKRCEDGYFPSGDSQFCNYLFISGCLQLDQVLGVCQRCFDSFTPSLDGKTCFPPIKNCQKYTPLSENSTAIVCKTCAANATLYGNFCFDGVVQNCETHSNGTCLKCLPNYHLTDDSLRCLPGLFKCSVFAPSTIADNALRCTECQSDYFIVNSFCAQTIPECTEYSPQSGKCMNCTADFKVTSDGSNCLPAIPDCKVYAQSSFSSGELMCLQCAVSKTPSIDGFMCVDKVIDNCVSFNAENGECVSCNKTFRLTDDRQQCLSQIGNCSIYHPSDVFSELFQCGQCLPGFDLRINTCRLKPLAGCIERNPSNGVCTKCFGSQRPTDDGLNCLPQVENCAEYLTSNRNSTLLLCRTCQENYIALNSNQLCALHIPFCDIYSDNEGYCLQCEDSFRTTSDFEVCLPQIPNCSTYEISYSGSSGLSCSECNEGYAISKAKDSCTLTSGNNNSTTVSCEYGWGLTNDGLKCLPRIPFCLTYKVTDKSSPFNVCLECQATTIPSITGDECFQLSATEKF